MTDKTAGKSKEQIAKHNLCVKLRSISTTALAAADKVEAAEDEWADEVADDLAEIESDVEGAYRRLDPFLEDEDGGTDEEEEEEP